MGAHDGLFSSLSSANNGSDGQTFWGLPSLGYFTS